MIPSNVQQWLQENGYDSVRHTTRVGGGCINNGTVVHTASGDVFFLKTNLNAPADMFACEALGLEELDVDGAPRVPQVYHWEADFILMEYIHAESRSGTYWPDFGRQLAILHDHQTERFGFRQDNYIGSTPQPNAWTDDGYEFFGEYRLLFQARLAREKGYFNGRHTQLIESLVRNLGELIPSQPASLLHGDLWSGNAIIDDQGDPAIIDPAVYYGWAEAELAMTTLFGSFPRTFYDAYQQIRKLDRGFRERFPVYNLYHLMNHLNLFGSSYLPQVLTILNRFA